MFRFVIKVILTYLVGAIVFIGLLVSGPKASGDKLDDGLWVEVEPSYLVRDATSRSGFELLPYKERRRKWSSVFSIGLSSFHPEFYEPDVVSVNFETLYGENVQYSPEIQWTYKRNTALGSFGLDLGLGYYQVRSEEEVIIGGDAASIDSQLMVVIARLGLSVNLDSIFASEPYVVPYLAGGLYTAYYRENQASLSFNGTTQAAPYFSGGLKFQLDWLDPITARQAYFDSGINNSFIFAEARKMMASQEEKDPDFETDLFWLAGLRLEF